MVNIVQEAAVFTRPEKVKELLDGKVVFETYLQEAETRNQNRRVYPKIVLDTGLKRISEKIKKRSFLGELDHPMSSNQIRQTTVLYKECSHIVREVGWEGNLLRGVVETTPYTANGRILSGLIMDKVAVGFSLRGLADVEDRSDYQEVMSPLIIIAFDSVSEPSNVRATIQEVKNENVVRVIKESKTLICCEDGHCYLPDYFDELVERKILKLYKRYF